MGSGSLPTATTLLLHTVFITPKPEISEAICYSFSSHFPLIIAKCTLQFLIMHRGQTILIPQLCRTKLSQNQLQLRLFFFFIGFSVSLPALSVASSLHSVDAVEMTTGVFGCVHAQVERGALREKERQLMHVLASYNVCIMSPRSLTV